MHTKDNPCTNIRTLESQTVPKYALIYKPNKFLKILSVRFFKKKDSSFILLIFCVILISIFNDLEIILFLKYC